jgi:hypothetical protein
MSGESLTAVTTPGTVGQRAVCITRAMVRQVDPATIAPRIITNHATCDRWATMKTVFGELATELRLTGQKARCTARYGSDNSLRCPRASAVGVVVCWRSHRVRRDTILLRDRGRARGLDRPRRGRARGAAPRVNARISSVVMGMVPVPRNRRTSASPRSLPLGTFSSTATPRSTRNRTSVWGRRPRRSRMSCGIVT